MTWRDKIPEIVIGSVIITGGGWILTETYGMNRTIGVLDAKLSETTGRIDRIAAVLPDIRVRIAKEELAKALVMAIVVLDSKKTRTGKWVAGIHVIDAATMTRNTYLVPVKGPQDNEIALLVSGAANEADSEALSFKTLTAFSSEAGTPTSSPSYVRAQNSFVLRNPDSEYIKSLNGLLRSRAVSQQTVQIKGSVGSWEKLNAELTNNSQKYEVGGNE
jgi:hypothetical protein